MMRTARPGSLDVLTTHPVVSIETWFQERGIHWLQVPLEVCPVASL